MTGKPKSGFLNSIRARLLATLNAQRRPFGYYATKYVM